MACMVMWHLRGIRQEMFFGRFSSGTFCHHFEATFGGFQEDLVSSDWAETRTVKQRCFLPQLLGD